MKRTILQKAAAAALFVLLTAALLAAADFLLVDDVHSYSRVMLQELLAKMAADTASLAYFWAASQMLAKMAATAA